MTSIHKNPVRLAIRPVHTRESIERDWQSKFPAIRREIDSYRSFMDGYAKGYPDDFLATFDPLTHYSAAEWIGMIPRSASQFLQDASLDYAIRHRIVRNFSFSIPSTEALTAIAQFVGDSPVIEYLAGRGYWAYLLGRHFGVKIIATDRNHYKVNAHHSFFCSGGPTFVPVIPKDVRRSRAPKDHAVMLSWIPCDSNIADRMLGLMRPGQKMIYVGETSGGCCAADSTFEIIEKQFEEVGRVIPPQFTGLHDGVLFYVRK